MAEDPLAPDDVVAAGGRGPGLQGLAQVEEVAAEGRGGAVQLLLGLVEEVALRARGRGRRNKAVRKRETRLLLALGIRSRPGLQHAKSEDPEAWRGPLSRSRTTGSTRSTAWKWRMSSSLVTRPTPEPQSGRASGDMPRSVLPRDEHRS